MEEKKIVGGLAIKAPWPKPPEREPLYSEIKPDYVYIPMSQHLGAPAQPLVQVGEQVSIGQLLGKADGNMSANVHASVSGEVVELKEMQQSSGKEALTVVIKNDHKQKICEQEDKQKTSYYNGEIIESVKQAGIVGMGGATFPSHIKLNTKDKEIEYCLLNGAECEPGIYADDMVMRTQPEKVVRGCKLIMQTTRAQKAIIAIEANKPKSLQSMEAACADEANIQVQEIPEIYPVGGEQQLIKLLLGREYADDQLPADAGVVLFNVATACAIADAVEFSQPLVQRICTVTGDVLEPKNVLFPLGTSVKDMLSYCGGVKGKPAKIILGGPMMGKTVENLQVPLTKSTNGLVVISEERSDLAEVPEYPCIRCNRCVDVCPMQLMPLLLDKYYREKNWQLCRKFLAPSCINCGCCTYVCPSFIPLAKNIVAAAEALKEREESENESS